MHVPYALQLHVAADRHRQGDLWRLAIIKKGGWRRDYDVGLIERLELAAAEPRLLHIDWRSSATSPAVATSTATTASDNTTRPREEEEEEEGGEGGSNEEDAAASSLVDELAAPSPLLPRHSRHSYVFLSAHGALNITWPSRGFVFAGQPAVAEWWLSV